MKIGCFFLSVTRTATKTVSLQTSGDGRYCIPTRTLGRFRKLVTIFVIAYFCRILHNGCMSEPESIDHLVRLAQGGDRQAMDELLSVLRPKMERIAASYADSGRPAESTNDLVQESLLRAWEKIDQFRGGDDDKETMAMFHGWVVQIVHRLGLNAQRDRRSQRRKPRGRAILPLRETRGGSTRSRGQGRRQALAPPAAGPTPSANARSNEEGALVHAALAKIPDDTNREIVRLRFFDGLSLRRISERLDLSYDKVRERYRIAIGYLENELGELQ